MKRFFFLLISLFAIIFYSSQKAHAQSVSDWKQLYLDIAGSTNVKGIEVFAQVNTCNDEGVINIKFINHNGYAVTVKWLDAVRTLDQKWIKKEKPGDKKSLTIEANKEIKGDCLSNKYTECIIKLKDFLDKPDNFYEYAIYHLDVLAL